MNRNSASKLPVTLLFARFFLKKFCSHTFKSLFGRSNRDAFLENESKIHEGGCVKEFFSLTCRLASRNFLRN